MQEEVQSGKKKTKRRKKMKPKKGFTLIELLVIIAVIVIMVLRVLLGFHPYKRTFLIRNGADLIFGILLMALGLFMLLKPKSAWDILWQSLKSNYEERSIPKIIVFLIGIICLVASVVIIFRFLGFTEPSDFF